MLLPPELLTLFFLSATTTAFPQTEIPTNVTSTAIEPTFSSDTPDPQDSSDGGWDDGSDILDPCMISFDPRNCWPVNLIPQLPTETGWDPADDSLNSNGIGPPTQTDVVITTRQPTIINVETNAAPTRPTPSAGETAERQGNIGQPATSGHANLPELSNTIVTSTANAAQKASPNAAISAAQPTAQNNLLLDIISRIGETRPNALPAHPTLTSSSGPEGAGISGPLDLSTSNINVGDNVPAQLPTGSRPDESSDADAPVQPTLAVGGTGIITLGATILTLTPGLSTTIGPDTDTTFVRLRTDATGNTLITLASSGIAVTATVTYASVTITMPKTGFEASITDVARPAAYTTELKGAPASTSSSGVAGNGGSREVAWWRGALLGILGFGAVL
ncbi:hypothetical protein BDW02DRAFT_360251 [Decorospora gaudefroyi]|uniref:Mid2 domain-containing protein n=1 Tax=Decorospora gaudefroyi TaxID=184978 RepID=A0A6A5KH37_9PLEO|nr:hypothetical protein BDW02DRAFT_360251 [Decorospora gaudefroyi]